MELTSAPTRSIKLSEVIVGGYLGMFLIGLSSNIYGPALVYLSAETRLSPATLGLVVVFQWIGFLSSTFTANRMARRFEMRRTLALAAAFVGIGTVGLIGLPLPINLASACIIGLGCGTIEILLNRLFDFLSPDTPAADLNRLHGMWGVGALAMPLVIAGAVSIGLNWRVAGVLVFGVAMLTTCFMLRWQEFAVPHGTGIQLRGLAWRSILLFVLMFVIYVGVEVSTSTWATTYFAKLGEGPVIGLFATSFFFALFAFGRLTLAAIPERLGYARTVRLAMLLGALAIALVLYEPLALIGFALTGIAFSLVFPTMIAWAMGRHPDIRPQIASVALASTGVGGLLFPYTLGWGVELLGAWALPSMLIVSSLATSFLALFEPDYTRHSGV